MPYYSVRYENVAFAVRCPVLNAAALCHPERSPFLVILNGAGGGVKDLEHHTFILFQILRCRSE